MNVLIYSATPQSPHIETDLELAIKLSKKGDTVTLVRCTGQLKVCLDNPYHKPLVCSSCRSKYQHAIALSKPEGVKIIDLPPGKGPYTFPSEFKSVAELKAYRYDNQDAGQAVATTLIGRISKDHKFSTVKYADRVRKGLETWVDTYNALKNILDETRPDEVYFFNGRFLTHHPLMVLAIHRGITWYTHERGGIMDKYILRKNAMPHNLEYTHNEIQKLWGEGSPEKEALGSKFFSDRRNNVAQSWISFTEKQQRGLLPEGFDHSKKNVVIFNSTLEEYEGMLDWANPIYADDNVGVEKVIGSIHDKEGFQLYLRVHPNLKFLDNSQMKEIRSMAVKYPRLKVIWPEENVHSYALLDNAFKVVTFGSTIGSEATFWEKPSVLLGKAAYMNLDACYEPRTHDEAVDLILAPELAPKEKINAVKYGYWEMTKGIPFDLFKPVDLFTMSFNGAIVKPSGMLTVLEKISKLSHIRDKRDLETLKSKVRNLLRSK